MKSRNGIAGLAVVGLLGVCAAQAQYNPFRIESRGPGSRAGTFEFYGTGQFVQADDFGMGNVTLNVPSTGLVTSDIVFDFDPGFWAGIGIGYNLNSHFGVNGEFSYGSLDYDATFADYRLWGEMLASAGKFSVDYNILAGPITPFVSVGLGYIYLDTGVPEGPPGYYCWWDYYWGEVCTYYVPTHTETFFTLDAFAGLRWDINEVMFVKFWGGAAWMDVGRGAGWPAVWQGAFSIGGRF
jgi:hypothetical protein